MNDENKEIEKLALESRMLSAEERLALIEHFLSLHGLELQGIRYPAENSSAHEPVPKGSMHLRYESFAQQQDFSGGAESSELRANWLPIALGLLVGLCAVVVVLVTILGGF